MVKEKYHLTSPLVFLDSEHFSLLMVTLRDDFSVFSVF